MVFCTSRTGLVLTACYTSCLVRISRSCRRYHGVFESQVWQDPVYGLHLWRAECATRPVKVGVGYVGTENCLVGCDGSCCCMGEMGVVCLGMRSLGRY